MCASAAASGLAVRGALLVGDLNCAAGSPEAAAMLAALRWPHTRDLAEPAVAGASADDASFPLGAWKPKRGAYALAAAPSARLDYILDASAAARADRKPLRRAEAAVERRIAHDEDTVLLSDHAAVVATAALPR